MAGNPVIDAHCLLLAQVSGTSAQDASLGEAVAEDASDQGLAILLFVVSGALVLGVLILAIKYHVDTN